MRKQRNITKKISAYLAILFLIIVASATKASAGILDWYVSSALATRIMIIVLAVVVGLVVVLVILIRSGVIGQALDVAKELK